MEQGPNSSVLPAVGAQPSHTRIEAVSSLAEICRTIPIALVKSVSRLIGE